ncbi:MAG: M48 family metallopeptidase [Armatimonadota bacterium]|nr:MAG: M48 family metallopeptidase [Armatimonadota bacterium]
MYEAISSNRTKSILVLILFVLVIVALGYAFGEMSDFGYAAPAVAFVFAIASVFTSYYYSDRIVLAMSRARPATKEQFPHLYNSVEGLSIAAGLPVPRLYIVDDSAPNAFATGRDPQHAVIAVTTGLLDKLDRYELEGVIGHEMAHIADYDIRFMTIIAVLVGTIALISDWMLRFSWHGGGRSRRRGGSGLIAIFGLLLAVVAPLIALLMQMALSRTREFLADAQGAMLTRYPEGLANALEKLAADTEPLEVANKATAHLYIINPLTEHKGMINNLFATHPPIEERVRRLREM